MFAPSGDKTPDHARSRPRESKNARELLMFLIEA
jgi:hypothetical protein